MVAPFMVAQKTITTILQALHPMFTRLITGFPRRYCGVWGWGVPLPCKLGVVALVGVAAVVASSVAGVVLGVGSGGCGARSPVNNGRHATRAGNGGGGGAVALGLGGFKQAAMVP